MGRTILKAARRVFWAILILPIIVMTAAQAAAAPTQARPTTDTACEINTPVNWTAAESPYVTNCSGPVKVTAGGLLTIESGATVEFIGGSGLLVDGGALVVSGASASDVTLTSHEQPPGPGDWKGIKVAKTGSVQLSGLTIRYAGESQPAVTLASITNTLGLANNSISNAAIEDTSNAGILVDETSAVLRDVTVRRSTGAAIQVDESRLALITVELTRLDLEDNAGDAVQTDANVQFQLDDNTVSRNGTNGLVVGGGTIGYPLTWQGGDLPFIIGQNLGVASTLTIEPDTVVKLANGRSLTIGAGRLVANGTAEQKIYFTTITDDEACTSTKVDCDTKNDGAATSLPGSWSKLDFTDKESGGSLSFAEVRYGSDAMVRIDRSGMAITETLLTQSSGDAVEISDHPTSIVRSEFVANAESAVLIRSAATVTVTLRDNVFRDNGSKARNAIVVMPADVTLINGGNETPGFSNGLNGYLVSGRMVHPHTWLAADLPYVVGTTVELAHRSAVLTFQPGLVVKMSSGSGFRVREGSLQSGTAGGARVLITSLQDDACSAESDSGCDTNGDRGGTEPQRGDWSNLDIWRESSGAFMRQTVLRYGASSLSSAQIDLRHADSSIEDCDIGFGGGVGVKLQQVNVLLADNKIHDNQSHGIQLVAGTTPQLVTLRGNEIYDNGLENDRHLAAAIDMDANAELALEGSNQVRNNERNGVAVHGYSRVTHRWRAGELEYLILDNVDVVDQSTLTIDPGVIVKLDEGAYLSSSRGTLVAAGTAQDPITFTSIADDSVGGDANPRDGNVSPNAGDWNFIRFDDTGGAGRLIDAEVRYGGGGFSPAVIVEREGIKLQRVTVRDSDGAGILLDGVGSEVADCKLDNLRGHGIRITIKDRPIEPVIHGNTITGSQAAIQMDADVQPDLADNSATGNTINGILVEGTTSTNRRWAGGDLVYVLGTKVAVGQNARLTLAAGTVVKAQPDSLLDISKGALTAPAEGSGTERVVLTSVKDDKWCDARGFCDTNGDGGITAPEPGNWKGITVGTGAQLVTLRNVKLFYGGSFKAALTVGNSRTVLENSEIAYSLLDGVLVSNAGATVTGNTFHHNETGSGLTLEGNSTVTIEGNVFTDNLRSITHKATGSVQTANNVAIGNVSDAMYYCADVSAGQEWQNDLAREIGCDIDVANGANLTIQPGSVIQMSAGKGFRVADGLYAEGVAFAATEPNPAPGFWDSISFAPTSRGFIRHNLLLFGGTSSQGMIDIQNRAQLEVEYNTLLRANQTGISVREQANPRIWGNIIRQVEGRGAAGIRIEDTAMPNIKNNRIAAVDVGVHLRRATAGTRIEFSNLAGTVTYGVRNEDRNVCVDAQQNWWSHPTGPHDESNDARDPCGQLTNIEGEGLPVSNFVNYNNWLRVALPTAPLVDSPRCGVTSQRTLTVSGSTSAGAAVNVYDGQNETPIHTVVAGGDGRFEAEITLSAGEHGLSFDAGTDQLKSARTGFRVVDVRPELAVDPAGIYFEYGPIRSPRRQPVRNEAGCATGCGGMTSGRVTLPPGEPVEVHVPVTGSATSVQFIQPGQNPITLRQGAGNDWVSSQFEPIQGPFTITVDGATPLECLGYVYPGGAGFVFADVGVTGAPVMDHSFERDGVKDEQGWVGQPPWELSNEDAYSRPFAWNDSPGRNYAPRTEATLSTSRYFNLRGVSAPTLRFWHKYRFARGDYGYVEGRAGADGRWVELAKYSSVNGGWESAGIPLDEFAREPRFYVRFRIKSDGNYEDDGWHIDNVSIGPGGALNGRFDVGEPEVSDAKVTLFQRDVDSGVWREWWGFPTGQINPQWTDSAGRYGFFNLPPGEYQFTVEPAAQSGYGPYRSPVLAVWNGTLAYNAPLTRTAPLYLPVVVQKWRFAGR